MNAANRLMILGALLAFSAGSASAGPCNTVSRDAGSGNVPGYTGQTIGSTVTDSKHPPTSVMNKATENIATSSQDAQRQMQGQPTAARQSRQKEAASEQSPKIQPAPNDQLAPSEKKPAGEDC